MSISFLTRIGKKNMSESRGKINFAIFLLRKNCWSYHMNTLKPCHCHMIHFTIKMILVMAYLNGGKISITLSGLVYIFDFKFFLILKIARSTNPLMLNVKMLKKNKLLWSSVFCCQFEWTPFCKSNGISIF